MKCEICNEDGTVLIRVEDRSPVHLKDLCDRCGDCLDCYGSDPCHEGLSHRWVIYGDDATTKTASHAPDCPCAWCRVDRDNAAMPTRAEVAALREWKESAASLLSQWDEVWIALGRPGELGASKAEESLKAVVSLLAFRAECVASNGA